MQARISIALERGSILWGSVLVGLVSFGMLVSAAGMLTALGDRTCPPTFGGSGCAAVLAAFAPWEQAAQAFLSLLWLIPTGLGALLGVAITAGEIERHSAQISWTLATSRSRWLLLRAVPVALVLLVVLSIGAGAAELAARGRLVTEDPGFHDYQIRGLLVPARGLLAFAIGLATGALLGRTLPALLVAIVFSVAITLGLLILAGAWHVAAASFVPMNDPLLDGGMYPLLVTRSSLPGVEGSGLLLIPASEYWVWVLRESGLFLLAAAAAALAAIAIVRRRSP